MTSRVAPGLRAPVCRPAFPTIAPLPARRFPGRTAVPGTSSFSLLRDTPKHFENGLHRHAVVLIQADVNHANLALAIDHERGRMRDVERVEANRVVDAVGLGDAAIFVEQ